jgi:hypothetical protein
MKFSFYCAHCKQHLSHGDHSKCKKILRKATQAAQAAREKERLQLEKHMQARYTDGRAASFLTYPHAVDMAGDLDARKE